MKKLVTLAFLVVFASLPSLARAATIVDSTVAAEGSRGRPSSSSSSPGASAGDPGDYAAREQAAPSLGDFAGGETGIYIGGGLVTVLLVVLLIVIIL